MSVCEREREIGWETERGRARETEKKREIEVERDRVRERERESAKRNEKKNHEDIDRNFKKTERLSNIGNVIRKKKEI